MDTETIKGSWNVNLKTDHMMLTVSHFGSSHCI